MANEPVFVSESAVLAFHAEQIERYGGAPEMRDQGLLESALSSPENTYLYAATADVFDLATAYIFAIGKNHPFLDGNKRTAAATGLSFLELNGLKADVQPEMMAVMVEYLVTGQIQKEFVATMLFYGCTEQFSTYAMDFEGNLKAPEQYAKVSKGEKDALVTDFVTATGRARLIELCAEKNVRPDRFDVVLDGVENELFKKVERKWRAQFGMVCDDDE